MNRLNLKNISRLASCSIALAVLVVSSNLRADELDSTLTKVRDLVSQKNYSAALEELSWARKEIEKMNSGQIGTFFPDQLAGFTGRKLESSSAMGFTNIERAYSKGSTELKVSLTGGSSGGADAGLGGLAAIGKMAAMFGGNTPGQETIRIQGRTAMLESESSTPNLTIFLDSGSILKIEMTSGKDIAAVKEVAGALKLDELEKYLKGKS